MVPVTTVRDATFDVMRRHGMTRIFGNPGSTEVPFLTDLPADIEFVMGLHEGAVVGMATGYALATGEPQFVNLHTAPGLGNAVNAIANARDTHAPLVIVVGQQDRKQLHLTPFLSGRALETRRRRVPGLVASAAAPAGRPRRDHARLPRGGRRPRPGDGGGADGRLARAVRPTPATSPATVIDTGRSGSPSSSTRLSSCSLSALTRDRDRRRHRHARGVRGRRRAGGATRPVPVWHEPFSGRAGFPEDHPLFAGHLDWHRRRMRETLAPHDVVLVLGTKAFQLYILDEEEPPVADGTRVAVVSADRGEALQSACEIAVVAPVAAVCAALGRTGAGRAPGAGRRGVPAPGRAGAARRRRAAALRARAGAAGRATAG